MCERVSSSEGIVYRDGTFTAFGLADRPGWVLYATDRHGDWTWGMTEDEASGYGPFLRRMTAAVKAATGATHVYYLGLGENSLHFHGLLVARCEPFAKDIQAAMAERGAAVADEAEARRLADAIREHLATGRAEEGT